MSEIQNNELGNTYFARSSKTLLTTNITFLLPVKGIEIRNSFVKLFGWLMIRDLCITLRLGQSRQSTPNNDDVFSGV